jgi:hypothetical protein
MRGEFARELQTPSHSVHLLYWYKRAQILTLCAHRPAPWTRSARGRGMLLLLLRLRLLWLRLKTSASSWVCRCALRPSATSVYGRQLLVHAALRLVRPGPAGVP